MMESKELQEIEQAHFIANEMNDAFDYADATGQSPENRANLMELAGTLAGVALLVGEENLPFGYRQNYVTKAKIAYAKGEDPNAVNLKTINEYIEENLDGENGLYARYDIDFEDEMKPEHRGKVMNKAYWHVKFREEVEIAHRRGSDLSLMFIDFNFVKKINDIHGHPEGDKVLRDIKTLFAMVSDEFRLAPNDDRPSDILTYGKNFNGSVPEEERAGLVDIGRLGGDEFAGICYTDFTGATVIEGRIRELVEEYVNREGKEHLKELGLSAAIGIATLTEDMTAAELLKLADDRMYKNKEEQKEARRPLMSEKQDAAVIDAEEILARAGLSLETVQNFRRRSS